MIHIVHRNIQCVDIMYCMDFFVTMYVPKINVFIATICRATKFVRDETLYFSWEKETTEPYFKMA